LVLLAGCPSDPKPTSTGTTCADPDPVTGTTTLTWQNFGYDFMCHYCTNCHDSSLKLEQRNGAPLFHDMDTLFGSVAVQVHIDQQAGFGPKAHNTFMPGAGTDYRCPSMLGGSLDEPCPEPTDEERTNLAQWMSCQTQRTAENASPDAMMTDHCAAWMATHTQ
jgi:hypothetical protein